MSTSVASAILASPPYDHILDSSDDDEDGPPILHPLTNDERRAIRAEQRAARKAESHAKADVFRRMGDELLANNKYEEAVIPYLEATAIWPSNPHYFIALAAAYQKLHWHEECAHAATRALALAPTNIPARYIRAVARLEQGLRPAARIDLETILTNDPSHPTARTALSSITDSPTDTQSLDFAYPHYHDDPLDVDEMSDSSDCAHTGTTGVPCRFYNRGRCGKGSVCPYSHAPDSKSVRDELGQNVCLYHLLDTCRFGEAKCVYSHDTAYLPAKGWWSSPSQTEKVKQILALTEQSARAARRSANKSSSSNRKGKANPRRTTTRTNTDAADNAEPSTNDTPIPESSSAVTNGGTHPPHRAQGQRGRGRGRGGRGTNTRNQGSRRPQNAYGSDEATPAPATDDGKVRDADTNTCDSSSATAAPPSIVSVVINGSSANSDCDQLNLPVVPPASAAAAVATAVTAAATVAVATAVGTPLPVPAPAKTAGTEAAVVAPASATAPPAV